MNDCTIDLNVDVGEGMSNESKLLPLVSSCNIACGGHAGDAQTMQEVVRLAGKHGVKIGAHPSYPDPTHFGRKSMRMSYDSLFRTLRSQVLSLQTIAEEQQLPLRHLKPHGALYNDAAQDEKTAEVIIDLTKALPGELTLYAPFGSVIVRLAEEAGMPLLYEVFADRRYQDDLALVPRDHPKAVITDPDEMYEQVYSMVIHRRVKTINGVERPIKADTLCIHGDHPNAIFTAKQLREKLTRSGVKIQ